MQFASYGYIAHNQLVVKAGGNLKEILLRFIVLLCGVLASAGVCNATQLNVWHMVKEMDADLAHTAAAFSRANPDINVVVHALPNEELKASAIRAADQQMAPDIIIISSDNVGYAGLMRLSELPPEWVGDTLPDAVQQALQFNQKNYSLPLFSGNHLLMLYNKALVNTPATDWQQLVVQQQEFNQQGIQTLALNYQEPYWFALFASLFGADLVTNNQVSLGSAEMAKALQFYQQLAEQNITQKQCGYACVADDFYQRKYAYAINGTWALAEAKRHLGDDLGIMPFPTLQQHKMQPLASYIVMVFPNQALSSAKAAQIKQFVHFIRQAENLQPLAKKYYLTPYYHTPTPEPWLTEPFHLQVQAQNRLSTLMPASTAMVSVWNGMQKGMLLHQKNTLDATAAASFMQKVALRDQQLLEAGQ
ncbi:sugar ABC transporter substrate-binding protein [Rheinheimera maricola]|uniref:Extracellular solute-binding protein n=1 Tax=Rheinheimera maricola TaxID=2793282 RepID=A0ABS7X5E6_9GAMM|nr:extracellular solute-binding protein [Rheinheimera maricola]